MSTIKHVEYHMKLSFKDIDIGVLKEWANSISSKEFSIRVYNGIPENLIEHYCQVLTEIENDMPDEPGNEEVAIDQKEIRDEKDVLSFLLFFKKEIIGLSRFFTNGSTAKKIYQAQFGVSSPYRNRGLAKFLLGSSYKALLRSHKQLETITVDTHPSNRVMIDLFTRIGFVYTHTETIYSEYKITDLTSADLPRIDWAGSPAHIRNVAGQLERVKKGEAEYLALRDPEGEPIAIGLIDHAFSGNGSEIGQLSTRQDLQSRGYGTQLIAAAEERIRQFGHEWSIMGVEPDNDRARTLYERLGYQAYGRTTDSWTAEDGDGNEYVKTVEITLMRKLV